MAKIPPMCKELTLDQIRSELVAIYQAYDTEYEPNESDEVMPVLETFAYRELQLRTMTNDLVTQSFWQTATGAYLDFHASEFFIERDAGAKPTAPVTFTLGTTLSTDYVLSAGLELLNEDGSTSLLLADVTFLAGSTEATGIAELQLYTATSDTKVISTMVPRAYLASVTQTSVYSGGSNPMSDDALRALIALANEQQTTAGSIKSYKYWALQADARISDVNVYSNDPGEVEVIVHSLSGVDEAMLSRVAEATSAAVHRPLTDKVNIKAAGRVLYNVTAILSVSDEVDASTTLNTAKVRLKERLDAVEIGKSITIGMIIAALSVDGIEDVSLSAPATTVGVGEDEVAILGTVEVSVG